MIKNVVVWLKTFPSRCSYQSKYTITTLIWLIFGTFSIYFNLSFYKFFPIWSVLFLFTEWLNQDYGGDGGRGKRVKPKLNPDPDSDPDGTKKLIGDLLKRNRPRTEPSS